MESGNLKIKTIEDVSFWGYKSIIANNWLILEFNTRFSKLQSAKKLNFSPDFSSLCVV